MKTRIMFITSFLIVFIIHYSHSQTGLTKEDYLTNIKDADEEVWNTYEAIYKSWQQMDPLMRPSTPPQISSYWARRDALLYVVSGDRKYAKRARKSLVESPWSDNYYTIMVLKQIKDSDVLSATDLRIIEKKIVKSADDFVQFWAEWGAMNHCSNHIVNSLTSTIEYLPHHPNVEKWRQKRDINLSANWGLWCIEDAQNYIPVWLKPMMQYADLAGREKEFYSLPMTKYYFDYLVQLMTPQGQIAEFGDGGIGPDGYEWDWVVSILEKGATVYRDGKMKWAAHRIFQTIQTMAAEGRVSADENLVEAYLWADDSVVEEVPTDGSRLVLEDYVGKKIIFRSGWDRKATYLFLNFLDDAPFGIDGKEHIINTINVETEKNHHGSADENAINFLMKDSSVLLCDGGYRETSSTGPDGEYRADTYHNKLLVRSGVADSQMRLLPFLLDGGRYRFVKTKLIHFRTFMEVDISRTRLIDEERGYQWDRLVNYLKGLEWFVVFDIVKILKNGPFTLANLFYTQDIGDYDQNDRSWYDTRYNMLQNDVQNPGNARLLVYFPEGTSFRRGAEQIRRCYQTEWAIYTAKADTLKAGDIVVFTTFLIPHSKNVDAKDIIVSLNDMAIYHTQKGYGVKIPTAEGYIQLNAMLDLEAEYLTENMRPRYNFASGRAEYGGLVTDACYCYLHKQKNRLFYSFFKASKLIYDGKSIFEAQGELMGQDDGSYQKLGIPKWVAWEDKVVLKQK